MKIVALLPVKNESWALPSYLSSVSKIADEIIALNDSSTDSSVLILNKAGASVFDYDSSKEELVNMGKRRQRLLELGRKAGGTHFVWLDADETFSSNFISQAKQTILSLKPGQKITMRWVHAWKNTTDYLTDTHSPFGYIWKDFIVCDDKTSNFEEKFLSEGRTPGTHTDILRLPEKQGVVIHWQFSRFEITQLKQALYRCTELIEGTRGVRKINHTYSITLPNEKLITCQLPKTWIENILAPEIASEGKVFYLEQITELFTAKGITFFEGLQIWHIPELHSLFIKKTGREPHSKVFPAWLVALNKLRHGNK